MRAEVSRVEAEAFGVGLDEIGGDLGLGPGSPRVAASPLQSPITRSNEVFTIRESVRSNILWAAGVFDLTSARTLHPHLLRRIRAPKAPETLALFSHAPLAWPVASRSA
jgi:hypothetical protein